MADMASKKRHVGTAKISREAALTIRSDMRLGVDAKKLAAAHGLTPTHVRAIGREDYWRA